MTFSSLKVFKPYLIQLERLIGSVKYSWQRDRWEEPFRAARSRQAVDIIQALVSAEAIPQGALFDFQTIQLKVEFQSATTVRLDWSLAAEKPWHQSLDRQDAAVNIEIDPEPVTIKLRSHYLTPTDIPHASLSSWEVISNQLRVVVCPSGCITFFDRESNLLRHAYPPQSLQIPGVDPEKSPIVPGWVHRSELYDAEHIYGLGEHAAHERQSASLPPYATQHDFDGKGENHLMAHNLYGVLQAQAAYDYLRQVQPEKRPFLLSRSGWAGLQKYAWTWTGDLTTSWDSLRQSIPTILNLGLSGIPYSGPDIGRFLGNPSPELYLRWFQLGCFLPFCRTHGSRKTKPRVPWAYGDQTLNIVREFLKLRYALIPYLYTLAWESHQTGAPLVRPLFWHSPEMEPLWDIEDAFLLGDALLICPIVEAGASERLVTLPPGHWYDFWNDQLTIGAQTITVKTSLDHIPIFVQAGQIVPMVQEDQLTLVLPKFV